MSSKLELRLCNDLFSGVCPSICLFVCLREWARLASWVPCTMYVIKGNLSDGLLGCPTVCDHTSPGVEVWSHLTRCWGVITTHQDCHLTQKEYPREQFSSWFLKQSSEKWALLIFHYFFELFGSVQIEAIQIPVQVLLFKLSPSLHLFVSYLILPFNNSLCHRSSA